MVHQNIHISPSLNRLYLLRSPNPPNTLRQPNIIRLKLIQSNTNHDRGKLQSPIKQLSDIRHPLYGDVIGDEGVETNVGVDQEGAAKQSIRQWVKGTGCEGRDCERDEAYGDGALEGPVVGAVRRVGSWDWCWIVCYGIMSFYLCLSNIFAYQFHQ